MLRKTIYLIIHPFVLLSIGILLLYLLWHEVNRQGNDFLVAILPEFASAGVLVFLAWLRNTVQLQRAVQQARDETASKPRPIDRIEESTPLADSHPPVEVDRQSDVDWLLERGLISKRQALLWPELEKDSAIQKALESIEPAT